MAWCVRGEGARVDARAFGLMVLLFKGAAGVDVVIVILIIIITTTAAAATTTTTAAAITIMQGLISLTATSNSNPWRAR